MTTKKVARTKAGQAITCATDDSTAPSNDAEQARDLIEQLERCLPDPLTLAEQLERAWLDAVQAIVEWDADGTGVQGGAE